MRILLMLLLFFQQTPKVEVLEKAEYEALVERGYALIDVRTPEEFKEGHIKGALNIDVKSESFVNEIQNTIFYSYTQYQEEVNALVAALLPQLFLSF